ncbi:AGE family epimerase/isomerase [Methylosinus sp. Sm6]|uniref:AGE family epimerase/isomerase n=1 Tax=Methylosinus sp. Sm6 TaxID=2866948 RepID=UPI001C99F9C9|nr:AGE family epimerase/isomerase [Methylosinus sp. Sm6]MBY6241622.1 AGE family epimerase/isomerase [Methylosinus sp. Sm6]
MGIDGVVIEARNWLKNSISLWAEHGFDRSRRGFHEHLTLDGLACHADFRRLRVLTRQIYVFSSPIGHDAPGARDVLLAGLDILLGPAKHSGGGYVNRFDLDGKVVDETRDLYDLAFVLFALCAAYRRLGDAALRDEARALVDFILARMSHADGGYVEALPARQPRRQNPHMHLLEAVIAWSEQDPSGPFAAMRDAILDLFTTRFFDPKAAILREYLADDLSPLPGRQGETWEPGHHFEWVWLLEAAARGGARPLSEAAQALMARACADGLHDGAGAVRAELDASGEIISAGARIWTLTEWIKAEAITPGPQRDERVGRAWSALRRYLATPVEGLWFERWTPEQGFVSDPAPATSLYHISMAVHEMCEGREP